MGITELIKSIGDENIVFQNLINDITNVRADKHDGKIEFATERERCHKIVLSNITGEKIDFVGLVLWIPRDKLPPSNKP